MTSDVLFYHDSMDVSDQIVTDLWIGLSQPKRSLYYNRRYGCDLSPIEGAPNTLFLRVTAAFAVAEFFADRNSRVTDGTTAHPDRRALTSQEMVAAYPSGKNLDLEIGYVEARNVQVPKTLTWSTGGIR